MKYLLLWIAILTLVFSGCSIVEEQNKRIKAVEEKLGEMEAKVQAVDSANQELAKKIEQVATDKSAERRLTSLEEKQSSMEKMQLELVQYQDSLRTSISRVKGSLEELKDKLEEVKLGKETAQKQPPASKAEAIQRPEEKTSGVVEIEVKQRPSERPKEKQEPKGFILDEF